MSAPDPLKGYKGRARARLEAFGVRVWSDVLATNDAGSVFEGVILPRSESLDDEHVVLKLKTGYNVGLHVDRVRKMAEVGYKEAFYKIPEKEFPSRPQLPTVTLLGTGGTIASRLDYRTGAVIPAFTPGELYGAVPELADLANLTTKKLFGVFSENMAKEQYVALAEAIGREIEAGVDGIVIGHGTDTMGHTAAILSFMVQDTPVPIVMVGSQRSSDRPSSDAALNLIHAVRAAGRGEIAEVQICMFGPTSDQYALLHRGTRCRKMHSSYRSTFRTIGGIPLAMVGEDFTYLSDDFVRRDRSRQVRVDTAYEDRTTILYYYPGMKPDLVDALVEKGYRGIVIAGTGLGHVNKPLYPALERAVAAGRPRGHDGADAVGLRADVRVRHRARPPRARRRPPRQHAPGDGAHEAELGARPHRRPRRGAPHDAPPGEPARRPTASPTTATSSCRAACRRRRSSSPATGSRAGVVE